MIDNVAAIVRERMDALLSNKASELGSIDEEIARAQADSEKASQAARLAAEQTNLDDYEAASNAYHNAEMRREMYSARRAMLEEKAFLSEEESDATIDSLLRYEEDLRKVFEAAVKTHIAALRKLYEEYRANIVNTENTIMDWTTSIHANHRTFGRTVYASGSTRSQEPVPVHGTVFLGGALAERLYAYLKKEGNDDGRES